MSSICSSGGSNLPMYSDHNTQLPALRGGGLSSGGHSAGGGRSHTYQQAPPTINTIVPPVKKTSLETPYQHSYPSRNSTARTGDPTLTNANFTNAPRPTNAVPRTHGGVAPMRPVHSYNLGVASTGGGSAYSGGGVTQSGGTNAASSSHLMPRPHYMSMGECMC